MDFFLSPCGNQFSTGVEQSKKKVIFTVCDSGKLELAFTSPNVISTSPKNVLMSRIDFTVLLQFKFLKKTLLARG